MSYRGTSTISCIGDNQYNLLIQDANGRVLLFKSGVSFQETVAEIENRMYLTEETDENRTAEQ